jgi:putative thioredoxin
MSATHELQQDFRTEVLEASRTVPVVVDFWAAWCGPCRILGPTLEKLAAEANGAWKLVKVDTEAWPELAQAFQIRSIPAVYLIHDEKAVARFEGALPEQEVRNWLRDHLPGGTDEEPAGDGPDAVRALARTDLEAATEKAADLSAEDAGDLPASLERLRDLARWGRGDADRAFPKADPENVDLYRQGAAALAQGDHAGAAEAWLALVAADRTLDEDGGRKALLALFDVLGPDDDLTQASRRRLSTLLF